jgi:protease-4
VHLIPHNRRRKAGFLALLGMTLLAGMVAGCGPTSFLITPVPASRKLREVEVWREGVWAGRKIALLDVSGVIRNARDTSLLGTEGDNPLAVFLEALDLAAADRNVRALVLRVNSPGGAVTASDVIYQELRRFRERSGKPVVTCMMDVAASGAYYIACASDLIIAHPTTVTGSIGVIMISPDVSGTMQKIGVRANVFKSGPLKDAGSPFRELGDSERAVFQSMIEQMYERFLAVVTEGRKNIPAGRLREIADGRVYTATQAKELGLIDEIGTLRDAVAAAKAACGLADEKIVVVQYAPPATHRPNIYARAGDAPAQVNLINLPVPAWLQGASPQFMYLWAPGW